MNPFFHLLGHPYNPVSDEYFESLPSAIKVTGMMKKTIKNNYNSLTENEVVDAIAGTFISFISDIDSDKYLYIDFDGDDIDPDEYKNKIRKLYSIAKKAHPKGVNRLVLSYLPPYQDTIDEYYSESKGNLTPKWLNPIADEDISEGLNKGMGTGLILNPVDAINDVAPYDLTEMENVNLKKMMFFVDNEGIESQLFAKMFLSKAIMLAREKETFTRAINLVWCTARKESTVEIFLSFYSYYKDIFIKEDLPFIHFNSLETMTEKLTCERYRQLNVLDERKVGGLLDKISNISTDSKSIGSIFQIRRMISNDDNFPSQKNLIKYIHEMIHHLFSQYKEKDNMPEEVIELIDNMPELNINHIENSSVTLFNSLSEFLNILSSLRAATVYIIDKKLSENKPIGCANTLHEEAIYLGKDPLGNLDRLQEISKEIEDIKIQEKEDNEDIITIFKPFYFELCDKIKSFNLQDSSKEKNEKDDLHYIVKNLKKELLTCKVDTDELKKSLHNKESVIRALESNNKQLSKPTTSNVTINDLSSLLSSLSVAGVISIINKMHGTIVLSPKAKQELSNLTMFCKHDLLTQKLGILSSEKFINEYMTKGSAACFSFFTNKELSFQESKTVKGKNERSFKFSDGKTRDCKAHLKICSNTKEQYQLRIYFKLEDNKVYIGMVTKHLDT
jgi:hypothetical protein